MSTRHKPLGLSTHLKNMLTAVSDAQSHVEGLDKDTFLANRLVQQAVSLNLIVIGELAGQIYKDYPEFTATHADVPWQDIRNMRNRLAHGTWHMATLPSILKLSGIPFKIPCRRWNTFCQAAPN